MKEFIPKIISILITILLVFAITGISLHLYFHFFWLPEYSSQLLPAQPTILNELEVIAEMERIESAITVFHLKTGNFPESLQELVEVELLEQKAILSPKTEDLYYYRLYEDSFVLFPPIFSN